MQQIRVEKSVGSAAQTPGERAFSGKRTQGFVEFQSIGVRRIIIANETVMRLVGVICAVGVPGNVRLGIGTEKNFGAIDDESPRSFLQGRSQVTVLRNKAEAGVFREFEIFPFKPAAVSWFHGLRRGRHPAAIVIGVHEDCRADLLEIVDAI